MYILCTVHRYILIYVINHTLQTALKFEFPAQIRIRRWSRYASLHTKADDKGPVESQGDQGRRADGEALETTG